MSNGRQLIEISYQQPIKGLQVPHDFYWVLSQPAPLAGMRFPRQPWPWAAIGNAGFAKIVALHGDGNYKPAPLVHLPATGLQDLVHGGPPRDPEGEASKIRKIVAAVVAALNSGQGVVVHCMGGRGRTGTVLGCAMRELGHASEDIVHYLDRIHRSRGKPGWPESTWQSSLVHGWPTTRV